MKTGKYLLLLAMFFSATTVFAEISTRNFIRYEDGYYEVLPDGHSVSLAQYLATGDKLVDVVVPATITHNGKTYTVTKVGDIFQIGDRMVRSLVLPETVTEIGEHAFTFAEALEYIEIPDNLLSIPFSAPQYTPWYDNHKFGQMYLGKVLIAYKGDYDEPLKRLDIKIKDGTRSLGPFSLKSVNCQSIELPESIEYVDDDALPKESDWYKSQPYGPVYINKVFVGYKSDSKHPVPADLDFAVKEGTKVIAPKAFFFCNELKSVKIPESVIFIGQEAFKGCKSLKSVTLPSGLKEITSNMIGVCSSLTEVKIPDSVEVLREWSLSSLNLKGIELPKNLKKIENKAFEYSKITEITIPASVTSIEGNPFYRCDSLKNIKVEAGNKYYCDIDGVLFSKDKTELIAWPYGHDKVYTLPETTKTIRESAFQDSKISEINLNEGLEFIGSYAFQNTPLTSVTFPKSLKYVSVWAFRECSKLKTITLPDEFPGLIDLECFDRTPWLDSQPDGVVYLNKLAWAYKGSMAPNTHLKIKEGTVSINKVFGHQTNLESIDIPSSVIAIHPEAFTNCTSLTSVTGGESVGYVGDNAFQKVPWRDNSSHNGLIYLGNAVVGYKNGVPANGQIIIKEGTTSLAGLGGEEYMTNEVNSQLKSIILPESLKTINYEAFRNIRNLEEIILKSPEPPLLEKCPGYDEFGAFYFDIYDKTHLVVPYGSEELYRSSTPWGLFSHISDPSGIDSAKAGNEEIKVTATDGQIRILGVNDICAEVYSVSGQLLYSGNESMIELPYKGICIVRVNGKAFKVIL